MTTTRTFRLVALAMLALPAVARAQSSLSSLGFGFPTGQLSTRALGTAGAIGEMDPLSAINPAVLGSLLGSMVYFQAEPEYRRLHVGGNTQTNTIARYPLAGAAFPVNQQVVIGFSASNFLDRSFETETHGTAPVGDTILNVTNIFASNGAIGDLRLAVAWVPQRWLKVGLAAHAITGDNRVRHVETFEDTTRFASLIDTATVGYIGNAFSGGFEVMIGTDVSVAGSYRKGGHLSLKRGDTTLTNAHVPDRGSISVAYIGVKGTTIAARTSHENWTRMRSLGTADLNVTDAWDSSIGADVLGPRMGSQLINLRTGFRWRTLPFGLPNITASKADVTEKTFSFGAGTSLGRGGRALLDVATFRSSRSATPTVSETAWTLSIGLTVRP